MRSYYDLAGNRRIKIIKRADDGIAARIEQKGAKPDLVVIASWGGGWDHVSVSTAIRCPTWDEMQDVKDMFFNPGECAMQLHPADDCYVNIHQFCLHMWRPHGVDIPTPPIEFV